MPVIPIARACAVVRAGCTTASSMCATRLIRRSAAARTEAAVRGTSTAIPAWEGAICTFPPSTTKLASRAGSASLRSSRAKYAFAA